MTASTTEAPAPPRAADNPTQRRAGWGIALRIARREVWRAKGRSALVLALVMLPVLVVTVLSSLMRTVAVSKVESLPGQMGTADAAIQDYWQAPAGERMVQCPDLSCSVSVAAPGGAAPGGDEALPPERAIRAVLGPGTRILALSTQPQTLAVGGRSVHALVSEVDLSDPMLVEMLELVDGRTPKTAGEVAVTRALAERGAGLQTRLDLGPFGTATVVGIVRSHRAADEVVAAPGALGEAFADQGTSYYSRWLVTAPGGVSWAQVLQLNGHGLTALSRQVIADPPSRADLASDPRTQGIVDWPPDGPGRGSDVATIGLIAAMVLLEVVLLAGPAFAVSASTQTRALGLLAAQGGTRRHLRRLVLAQAVVLGGLAATVGVLLGLLVSRLAYPLLVDAIPPGQIGPFEVGWADVVLTAVVGFGSAVLAALAPARAVARMDPVRAIAGRRPASRTTRWHPLLGGVLIGTGVVLAGLGARPSAAQGSGSLFIAAGAVAAVVGVVLVAPLAITTLGRAAGRAPLSPRFALRDMARNQLRSAPAVAAVAAVVAGAVALGIAGTSDAAQGRAQYVANGPHGDAVITLAADPDRPATSATWHDLAAELTPQTPGSTARLVSGLPDPFVGGPSPRPTLVLTASTVLPEGAGSAIVPGSPGAAQQGYATGWYGSALLVGHDGLAAVRGVLDEAQGQQAAAALAEGAVVVLRNTPGPERGTATLDKVAFPEVADDQGPVRLAGYTVPAIGLSVPGTGVPAAAILPEPVAARAGVDLVTSALVLDADRDLTAADRERLQYELETSPTLTAVGLTAYVTVEPGWQNDLRIVLLILGGAAGVLVLAGSLTAALLALSDARADFATLGAVGASPRTRRRIAGAYGWAIAFLGAVLGAAVGFIPGVAITYPLTTNGGGALDGRVDLTGAPIADHYLVVPWTMVVLLVVGLPVVVGLVVAGVTRSRLPMVARID